ncbi:DUF4178 domain-containing protein [Roseateles sp. DAIF2]|uniref:DUF4178 domain-containing protein n=1 Tax=Roseateles sp. DAIF2 TaxID=2714952 RepID=UPI0018A306AA|nr:DUF4178 domain-containing protein [Roseateles sp. DAIF2]QPF74586.1 DUF4178 domain-containing protein [Roseateles sp. DAIF2]
MVTPNNPQRRWQAACPNCGGPVEFASPASASAVCSFCRSTLLREGEALRKIGQSAELFEDYSPLQLGAAGRYAGAAFTVVGRLQIGYPEGSWNEWHLLFDGGPDGPRSGWLSEDNGAFVLAFDAPLQERAPSADELKVGAQQVLAGRPWQVASKVQASLLAAEGELPRPPGLPARAFWVADLRNAQGEVATLDYGDPAAVAWSIGRSVPLAELALTGLRAESSKTLASKALPCPSCGAALEPRLENTRSIVCGQCHAVVDISQGAGADLAHYAQANGMEPQLRLGSEGQLALLAGGKPLPWQVVGYLERCDLPDSGEDEQSFWREYLLYNRLEGFAFLVDTAEGWSLVRPLTGAPRPGAGGSMQWQGKVFKQRWSYDAKATYVLGEFYWRIQREERVRVTDYEGPGVRAELLSREQTGNELTWSHGRQLDAAEVLKAFKLAPEMRAALKRDTAALSDSGTTLRNIVIGLFLIAFLFALLRSCDDDDCEAYKSSYGESSAEYQQCKRSSSGSGVRTGSGGSYGGFSSGGGSHK